MNFDVLVVNADAVAVSVPKTATQFVPWCGLLFDTVTGAVHANYSRYVTVGMQSTGRELCVGAQEAQVAVYVCALRASLRLEFVCLGYSRFYL